MVHLPWTDLAGRTWRLDDLLTGDRFERDGDDMATAGLYVALPPWAYHVLKLRRPSPATCRPRSSSGEVWDDVLPR